MIFIYGISVTWEQIISIYEHIPSTDKCDYFYDRMGYYLSLIYSLF